MIFVYLGRWILSGEIEFIGNAFKKFKFQLDTEKDLITFVQEHLRAQFIQIPIMM